MTFELLLKPLQAERKPYLLFLMAFLITTIAIILGYNIFPESSSILIITFCVIPLVPIMVKLMEIEEERFSKSFYRLKNYRILKVYTYLFLGFIFSFAFFYTFMPQDKAGIMFKEQIKTLYDNQPARAKLTGEILPDQYCDTAILSRYLTRYNYSDCRVHDYYKDGNLEMIIWLEGDKKPSLVYVPDKKEFVPYKSFIRKYFFISNMRILAFVFLTSFIFGSGALFVLIWNASIIGIFVGEIAHRSANLFARLPFAEVTGFFVALPISLWSLVLHGIPEIFGFFISALAGGILAAGILRHKIYSKEFIRIAMDSLILFGISIILISLAAFLEAL